MTRLICATAMAAFLSVACANTQESNKSEKQDLTGTFVSPAGYAGTFIEEGYFSVVNPRRVTVQLIEYRAKDGIIWFRDLSAELDATEEEAACAIKNKGQYTYTEEAGKLSFELIEDLCPSRIKLIEASNLTRLETAKRPKQD